MQKLNKKRYTLVGRFYDLIGKQERLDIPSEGGQHVRITLGQTVFVNHDGRLMTIGYYQPGAIEPEKMVSYIVVDRRDHHESWEKPLQVYPVAYKDPDIQGEYKGLRIEGRYCKDISARNQIQIAELGDTWLQELNRRGYLG